MKKVLLFFIFIFLFSNSCIKNNKVTSRLSLIDLQKTRDLIGSQFKQQLDTSKKIFAQSIKSAVVNKQSIQNIGSPSVNSIKRVIYFDTKPIKAYYSSLFNFNQSIKSNKSNSDDSSGGDGSGIITISSDDLPPVNTPPNAYNMPFSNLISDQLDYQNQYIQITSNYTDLNSYTIQLNGLENTIYSSQITDYGKISLTYQIEFLKAYANDLETNLGYYENLCSNNYNETSSSISNSNTLLNGGKGVLGGGCKVNVGDVLMGGVISGFSAGGAAAYAGAGGGTVMLPVIGTVSGAVGGFMGGFAVGFVGGVFSGTIGSLSRTCFH